jgi:CRP-like cAMP-binding protein
MANVELLRGVPFLSPLAAEDLETLASHAETVAFAAGDDVLVQGAPNDSLFIVAAGTLHAARLQGGRRLLLGRLGAGSFFGELSAFDPGPTTGGVRAVTDGVIVRIRRAALDSFAAARPAAGAAIYRGLLAQVAHRLREADARVADLVTFGKLEPAN